MFHFESRFRIFQQLTQPPFEDRSARSSLIISVIGFGIPALAVLLVIIGVIIWSHGTRVPPVAAPATTAHKLHLTPAQPSIEPRQQ